MTPRTLSPRRSLASILLAAAGVLASGCAAGPSASHPSSSVTAAISGRVHGGQQPVSGARIRLMATGSAGPGAGASDLLAATPTYTDAGGSFNVTGEYTCPFGNTQIYLLAQGGNPGLAAGTSNPALLMMTPLGNCGDFAPSAPVMIDEVTTVASAWALSQFLGASGAVGSSSTNPSGIQNAFASVRNLVDPATGLAPGVALPATAQAETGKINALADALAACVNSDGGSACAPLFAAASSGGALPSNTLDAALNIVRAPAANVAAVFQLAAAQSPFQPALTVAPHDWTLSVTFGVCASGCGGLDQPGGVAIDSTGAVWVANYFGGAVSKFSPTGVAAAPAGYPGAGLRQSTGLTIDPSGHVWVANETSVTGAANSHLGSMSKFDSTGNELSGFGYTGGGLYYPVGLAADSAGNIWAADYGHSAASLLSGNGSPVSPAGGFGAGTLPFPTAVAVDAAGNAWLAVQGGVARLTTAGAINSFACCVYPAGVAIDRAGDVWLADYGGAGIVELSSAGTVLAQVPSANGSDAAQGIAVDGAGNIWAANFRGNSVEELAGASAQALSPAAGLGLDAPLQEPLGLAIDASGNLWLSNAGASTLTEFVGLAAPVRTPLLGPPGMP